MLSLKKFSLPGGTDAWKAATVIFLISRFIIFICTYMAWSRFVVNNGVYGKETHECLVNLGLCLQSWNQFDARYFVGIAHYGYGGYSSYTGYNPQHPYAAAFFPLYPLLIREAGLLFGGSYTADYIGSLLVANLCFFFALIFHLLYGTNDFDTQLHNEACSFWPSVLSRISSFLAIANRSSCCSV